MKWKCSVISFPKRQLRILADSFFVLVLQSVNTEQHEWKKNVTLIFNSNFEKTKLSKQGIQRRETVRETLNWKCWESFLVDKGRSFSDGRQKMMQVQTGIIKEERLT